VSAGGIAEALAWEALDSRGSPTVACEVTLVSGARGLATVPSGASTGRHEALELRDGGERYGGRGATRAVENVNRVIGPSVAGADAGDQAALDGMLRELDGSPGLGRLGANAVLAVSVATARAAAAHHGSELYEWLGDGSQPLLPLPMVSILSGGAHAGGAVDLQDFLAVPLGATSFAEAIEQAWLVRRAAFALAAERGLPAALVADEGGLGVPLPSNRAALELLAEAIERAGVEAMGIAIDVAATQLEDRGGYRLGVEDRRLDATELVAEIAGWCDAFPIVSVEDPLGEDDWEGWRLATRRLGGRVQLLGDDLFVTDLGRLGDGIAAGVANAVLVKPNQTGTLSDARAVIEHAGAAGYRTVVSARSGDTEDPWLADLAVGWRAGQIKVGSLARSERTAKWNRLLGIEARAGGRARFAGRSALHSNLSGGRT